MILNPSAGVRKLTPADAAVGKRNLCLNEENLSPVDRLWCHNRRILLVRPAVRINWLMGKKKAAQSEARGKDRRI